MDRNDADPMFSRLHHDPAEPRTPRLVGADVVARMLNVTRRRAYELARDGMLPSIRIGRQVRFDPLAIESWIATGGCALPGGWRREPIGEA